MPLIVFYLFAYFFITMFWKDCKNATLGFNGSKYLCKKTLNAIEIAFIFDGKYFYMLYKI